MHYSIGVLQRNGRCVFYRQRFAVFELGQHSRRSSQKSLRHYRQSAENRFVLEQWNKVKESHGQNRTQKRGFQIPVETRNQSELPYKNSHSLFILYRIIFQVLDSLNLIIEPGQTIALVGSSGAGKSTIVGLLLRFYDPEVGQVTLFVHNRRTFYISHICRFQIYLDSIKLPSLNIHWLRDQIGIVSQEPILFGVSIADNIRYGRDDITNEELIEAAIQAGAHDFIKELPNVMYLQ